MVLLGYGSGAQPSVWQPDTLQELQNIREQIEGTRCYVAGGTLLRTQWEAALKVLPEHLVSLACIPEINGISIQGDEIVIGAMTRLRDCAADPLLGKFPILHQAILAIAAPSVRNLATIGGNIASGIGDTLPALLVYDAELHWLTCRGMETQHVALWLENGRDSKLNADDVLISIHIPSRNAAVNLTSYDSEQYTFDSEQSLSERNHQISFYRKLGRREAFTASLVTVAFHGEVNPDDGRWARIAIAAGGGSGMAVRLTETEQWLRSGKADASQAAGLATQAVAEFVSYTDAFASESYRIQSAGNMLGAGLWQAFHP
ncbi:xanthine dehydrogenase family protein subunit M [Paenibacillus xylanexedens]|uniref:FAD binding domain-containing protein n=1 Tax=Paenibacillus xylanexedens TaxID=528191 RepID=UPI00164281B3|nr:FAD binding domain-containing protein [Paenibacillus xylanexedens]